jgi:hypothetical protein
MDVDDRLALGLRGGVVVPASGEARHGQQEKGTAEGESPVNPSKISH